MPIALREGGEEGGGSEEVFDKKILTGLMLAVGLALVVALLLHSAALADKGLLATRLIGPAGYADLRWRNSKA